MKRALVFIPGMILSTLLLMGSILGIRAVFAQDDTQSDNTTPSLIELIPDIKKIYREALTTPLNQVKQVIYDKEIGEFYELLLRKTGLDQP